MPSTAILVKDSAQGCASGRHPLSKTNPHGLPSHTGILHTEEQKRESVKGQQDVSIARDPSSPTCMKNSDGLSFYESGRTDSGFLSGANLSSECPSVEITSSSSSRRLEDPEEGKEDSNISMKLDSGLDLGLHERFSSLSLKNSSLNDLNVSSSKSHSHDYSHISNINILSSPTCKSPPHTSEQPKQHINYPTQTWELYFTQDEDGDTQLHIAIIQGFIEVVYSLIRIVPHPCYLDILNDVFQTPLHLAVLTHQARIARCLLVAGANVDIRDSRGNTALHLACQIGDIECVKALTEPITVAESNNANLQYTTFMHQVPQNLEERNYDGQMCVHLAAIGGHVDVLRHLVWFGANINAREGKSGRTALHYAVEYGIHRVTRFLLEECPIGSSGVQLEMPTYAGYTAYQLAACMDSALARELADKGALQRGVPEDEETDSDYSDDEMYGMSSDNYFSSHRINGEPINISA